MKRIFSVLSVLVVIMSFVLTGCEDRTPQTVEGFSNFMKGKSFTIQDVTADTETNGLAKSVIVAVGKNYQLEFYELNDSETGEGVFYNNQNIFDEEHNVKTASKEISIDNYNYYAFNADGDFHMIARIDNTMLYCVADKTYKDEIVNIVKELGYN